MPRLGPSRLAAFGLIAPGVVFAFGARTASPDATAGGADASAAIVQALSREEQAEVRFLEHLGWRFVRDDAAKEIVVTPGTPCYRRDLAAAHAGGDLRIAVPARLDDAAVAAFAKTLPALADSVATRCAYKQRLAIATRTATAKLGEASKRGDFTFPQFLVLNSPWYRCELPEPEWREEELVHHCTVSPSKAIEAVYARGGVAECYVGQWLAIFATQMELYGAAWFDEVFSKEEVRVGRPGDTAKAPIGRFVNESEKHPRRAMFIEPADEAKDPTLVLAQLGPKAFVGQTGVIQNEFENVLANQNFLIVSVTPRAVEELKRHGGLGRVTALTREALASRRASRKGISTADRKAHRDRYEALMADPVLSEITVYVHPFGAVPLTEVLRKELEEHERAMKLRIYLNGVDDHLWARYRTAWKARWLRENPAR